MGGADTHHYQHCLHFYFLFFFASGAVAHHPAVARFHIKTHWEWIITPRVLCNPTHTKKTFFYVYVMTDAVFGVFSVISHQYISAICGSTSGPADRAIQWWTQNTRVFKGTSKAREIEIETTHCISIGVIKAEFAFK